MEKTLDNDDYKLSASNEELLTLAEECAKLNAERFMNNPSFKEMCGLHGFNSESKGLMSGILVGIIAPDEHYSYVDSKYKPDDPAPQEIQDNNKLTRKLISSHSESDIEKVNHLIQLQIEGAEAITDKVFGAKEIDNEACNTPYLH